MSRIHAAETKAKNSLTWRDWLILLLFFLVMLLIHRYIFLYADDLYYSRDAQYGLAYLPEAILDEVNSNGRAWIGGAMVLILRPQIELFRILNPLILVLTVYILAKITTFSETSCSDISSFTGPSYTESSLTGPSSIKSSPSGSSSTESSLSSSSSGSMSSSSSQELKNKKGNPTFWIALLSASLFFLFLPLRIAHTTIYYAACAFNYLYPMALALLYAYLLYRDSASGKRSKKLILLILAFFVGSSTQQMGMIGLGFTVMISVYLSLVRKRLPFRAFLPYFGVIFLGYSIVTYGSFKRLLWEKTAGNEVILSEAVTELLKTNIFSAPAAPFVLLLGLSSIFWLITFSRSSWRIENPSSPSSISPVTQPSLRLSVFNIFLAILLSLALTGYIYFFLYKNLPIVLNADNLLSLYGLGITAFVFVYLFALVYTSALLLIKRNYPFLLFNSINAIGAQIMLIVVDACYAAAYKVMFPSLLLFSIYIFYSVLAFRKNNLYLALAFFLVTLSLRQIYPALVGGVILLIILIAQLFLPYGSRPAGQSERLLRYGLGTLFCLISVAVFSITLQGYYKAAIPQNYNLQAIRHYHEVKKEGTLLLKKVPPSYYGYNLSNWNDMPYFMKQCYGIKEDTPIEYLD